MSKKYYERVLVLALEYKKLFMDEWTGEVFKDQLEKLISQFKGVADIINSRLA